MLDRDYGSKSWDAACTGNLVDKCKNKNHRKVVFILYPDIFPEEIQGRWIDSAVADFV